MTPIGPNGPLGVTRKKELLLATLDAAELGHACRTVAALAARVAPLLRMVHGTG